MARYLDDSDPRNVWGDDSPAPETSRPKQSWGTRDQRRASRPKNSAPAKNQRPAEVSENVWGLAEQWLELGTATMGRRPPVNLPEFSKRFAEVINRTDEIKTALSRRDGHWQSGPDYVTDLLADMVQQFWANIETGSDNSTGLQFYFLEDAWAWLLDRCQTNLAVRRLKANGLAKVDPIREWTKDENPVLKAAAAAREREFLATALEEYDANPDAGDRRKRDVRKPLRTKN